jgi:hypothetical protein
MISYIELKRIYLSDIVLFILLLFVILYIIYNYDYIRQKKFLTVESGQISWSGNMGQVVKPILMTGIIFLIVHMLMTWDDDLNENLDINMKEEEVNTNFEIPKYNFGDNLKDSKNDIMALKVDNDNLLKNQPNEGIESVTNKYKIINKSSKDIFIKPQENKLSNHDIFIKKKGDIKYGLKF